MAGRTARGERKRKPDFIVEEDDRDALDLDDHAPRFKEKHSLDSDEEDTGDDKTHNVLHEDDIEGQEAATVDFDEGIQITPFNMTEEMEEGHFDKTGNFIFDKNAGQVQDHWMDNIDWVKVKRKQMDDKADEVDDSSNSDGEADVDTDEIYRQIIEIVKPGETIAKSLRRLGGGNKAMMSASQRLKAKKQKLADGGESDSAESEQNKQAFFKLTGLADQLLSTGLMEIYESTYEKIMYTINQKKGSGESAAPRVPLADGLGDDAALDMFADDLDSKPSSGVGGDDSAATENTHKTEDVDFMAEVQWVYREKDEDDGEILGPFSSSQMLIWHEESKFPDGVYCRKANTEGPFYNSKRIDFDLYT